MDDGHIANEIERINKRNNYAVLNYGHLPTEDLNLEAYINKTISDAIRIDYHEGVCNGYRNLALHYIISDSAIDVYEILLKIENLIKTYDLDELNTLQLYSAYIVYYIEYVGDLITGTKYAEKGLALAEKLNNKDMIMRLKSNLGVIYVRLGYYESAKELLESALEYYNLNNDEFHAMYTYNNLGEVYLNLELIEKAKVYYQKALQLSKDKEEITIRIDSSTGLSEIYAKEKHYTDAIEIIDEVINYLKISKNVRFEIEANIQLANIYIQQGIYKAAYNILYSLGDKLKEIENQAVLIRFYELYSKVAKHMGEYEVAFKALEKYHEFYVQINDLKAERAINEAMQNEYKKTISRLVAIARVGRELTILSNIDEVLYEVKLILSKLMDINGIGIGEVKDEFIEFNHFLVEGYKMEQQVVRLDDANSLAAWSIHNNKEVQVNDIETDYALYIQNLTRTIINDGKNDKSKTQSVLYAPLIIKGETIGVFTIQSFKKNAFLSEELEMFRIIVAYVAIAFKNISQAMILEKLSIKDSLTGMNNRRGFTEFYKSMVNSVDNKIESVSFIMLDLDYFKKINDKYGHVAGDEVLIRVAKVFMSKEAELIISARLGGEEFGFILLNKTKKEVVDFAEMIRREIEELEILFKEDRIRVTTSLGVTLEFFNQETNFKQLYFEADKAMLYAKNSGRNRVEVFETTLL